MQEGVASFQVSDAEHVCAFLVANMFLLGTFRPHISTSHSINRAVDFIIFRGIIVEKWKVYNHMYDETVRETVQKES